MQEERLLGTYIHCSVFTLLILYTPHKVAVFAEVVLLVPIRAVRNCHQHCRIGLLTFVVKFQFDTAIDNFSSLASLLVLWKITVIVWFVYDRTADMDII